MFLILVLKEYFTQISEDKNCVGLLCPAPDGELVKGKQYSLVTQKKRTPKFGLKPKRVNQTSTED